MVVGVPGGSLPSLAGNAELFGGFDTRFSNLARLEATLSSSLSAGVTSHAQTLVPKGWQATTVEHHALMVSYCPTASLHG